MADRFYNPWIGSQYNNTRLLLLSESAYSWPEGNELIDPGPDHPIETVKWAIESFPPNRFVRGATRAISGKETPGEQEREAAWNEFAYSIFIPGTVGTGPGGSRTKQMLQAGIDAFFDLIEELKPEKIVLTSLTAWSIMPDCDAHLDDKLQAYLIKAEQRLAWCLAVPHPANRWAGFDWRDVAQQIALFRASKFPRVWPLPPV